jgi:hypothetical protein
MVMGDMLTFPSKTHVDVIGLVVIFIVARGVKIHAGQENNAHRNIGGDELQKIHDRSSLIKKRGRVAPESWGGLQQIHPGQPVRGVVVPRVAAALGMAFEIGHQALSQQFKRDGAAGIGQ